MNSRKLCGYFIVVDAIA